MDETRQEHAVYGWGRWYDKYDGRECVYARPEGYVLIYMQTFDRGSLAGIQHIDFEMIHNRRQHRMVQRRPPSKHITETGALRIATQWAKEVASAPIQGEEKP